ncbi:hypothetical protein F5883DRAFT_232595 [Diaporthe sp. PMI_573]|nr:hypothetical protein F5883DRAFT_232595 [Diaporthaceae sp. PMI_573]
MEIDVLHKHIQLVLKEADAKAQNCSPPLRIDHLVLSFPNYLEDEDVYNGIMDEDEDENFEPFIDCYVEAVREVCGNDVKISWITEGQAVVVYICEPHNDPAGSYRRKDLIDKLYEGLAMDEGAMLNLVVADGGSSSLNIQVQSIYLTPDRTVANSQSNVNSDWHTGKPRREHQFS